MRSLHPIITGAAAGAIALLTIGIPTLGADPPVTLRFAISEPEGGRLDDAVRAVIADAADRSGGSLVLQPIWSAGGDRYEEGVAQLLVDGEADLALTGSKGFPTAGVPALDALLTPYLITDGALATAVATSSIADDLLGAMEDHGAVGLALWPMDLGHPVAFETCTPPLITPDAFAGITVRAIPSWITTATMAEMGATARFVDNWQEYVDRCEVHAAESSYRRSLPAGYRPTFTGDLTFGARYQVLAANPAAWGRLTVEQQAALRGAAEAARDLSVAAFPDDATDAARWCEEGGRVVLAGPEALEDFRTAAGPVVAKVRSDPVAAAAIDGIEALKAQVAPSAPAVACEPGAAPSASPSDPRADGFRGDPIPDGTYRISVTVDDLLEAGATERFARANGDAVWTLTISGERWTGSMRRGSGTDNCAGDIITVDGPAQQLPTTYDGGCGMDADLLWRPAPDGVELKLIAVAGDPGHPNVPSDGLLMDRVWTRIE